MRTREEYRRACPPISCDSTDGLLICYAIDYANLLNARAHASPEVAAGWQARCDRSLARLSARLSPARFAFETDEARRYGEEEARETARFWRRG